MPELTPLKKRKRQATGSIDKLSSLNQVELMGYKKDVKTNKKEKENRCDIRKDNQQQNDSSELISVEPARNKKIVIKPIKTPQEESLDIQSAQRHTKKNYDESDSYTH